MRFEDSIRTLRREIEELQEIWEAAGWETAKARHIEFAPERESTLKALKDHTFEIAREIEDHRQAIRVLSTISQGLGEIRYFSAPVDIPDSIVNVRRKNPDQEKNQIAQKAGADDPKQNANPPEGGKEGDHGAQADSARQSQDQNDDQGCDDENDPDHDDASPVVNVRDFRGSPYGQKAPTFKTQSRARTMVTLT